LQLHATRHAPRPGVVLCGSLIAPNWSCLLCVPSILLFCAAQPKVLDTYCNSGCETHTGKLCSCACAMMLSMSPYCWISYVAVLGPMPFAPGTLSTASPARAKKSLNCTDRRHESATACMVSLWKLQQVELQLLRMRQVTRV